MPRYVAQPALHAVWDIAEIDADGIGARRIYVGADRECGPQMAQGAARLLVLALSLPGGIEEATKLLRAEMVRQS